MVELHLDLRDPTSHRLAVTVRCAPRLAAMRLQLPGWTPGSYLIRDYVRHLEGLEVLQGGRPLPTRRLTPACWLIHPDPGGAELEIRYALMATELSVRTAYLDQQHGFLPLASVVLELEGERWSPHRLRCALPDGWQAFLPLSGDPCGPEGVLSRDLDQLIDSPLELGPHREHSFSVAGVPHRWVCWAEAVEPGLDGDWLLRRFPALLQDLEQVCLACCRLMGQGRPASGGYLFILHLLEEGYGGLEHDDGCVLVYGRRALEQTDGYRKFLQLVAHEYLHQWNVRRLRPLELCPIDYHQPVPVPTLWFAEGVTSYVDQLLPLQAGLTTPESLLEDLGADLSRYLLTPGRGVQSLHSSSEEAWVKLYRADAYAADSQISYYLKGAVLALCLDLHLRGRSSCLAAVLQRLWSSHGRWGRGYSEADLLEAFAVFAPDLREILPRWLHALDDPDLDGYLKGVGLVLEPVRASHPWSGLTAAVEGHQLVARRVQRDSPAQEGGVMVGDELLALDGLRLRQPDQLQAGWCVERQQDLLICRRSRLQQLRLRVAPPVVERYRLIHDPAATPQALQQRQNWLSLLPEASGW